MHNEGMFFYIFMHAFVASELPTEAVRASLKISPGGNAEFSPCAKFGIIECPHYSADIPRMVIHGANVPEPMKRGVRHSPPIGVKTEDIDCPHDPDTTSRQPDDQVVLFASICVHLFRSDTCTFNSSPAGQNFFVSKLVGLNEIIDY
jgi:hypothetical protein